MMRAVIYFLIDSSWISLTVENFIKASFNSIGRIPQNELSIQESQYILDSDVSCNEQLIFFLKYVH